MLDGRDFVIPDDVKRLAVPVLGHRVVLSPDAHVEGVTAAAVVKRIVQNVAAPR
jgi:MoxR-like ATPase